MDKYYAHSKEGTPQEQWHVLKQHLEQTSYLSGEFAAAFGMAQAGEIIGLLHDAGKYSKKFQARLSGSKEFVDHSTAGAQIAAHQLNNENVGKILAYAIAGHHSGLPNGGSDVDPVSLEARLKKELPSHEAFYKEIPLEKALPSIFLGSSSRRGFSVSFLIRMLFSCLVDADYLDTESFYQPNTTALRQQWPQLSELNIAFEKYMRGLLLSAEDTEVNRERDYVRGCCRQAAEKEKGIFTLMVPTGGGKTLASLEFALHHAHKHKSPRIIYAIPFTSIIEQTASVFRDALGGDAVLEHHSNYNFDESDSKENYRLRLAAENWDAPLVVTTNVQFFESLMAGKSSRCRKLHNIANSVIILDEVQTLPDDLLLPCIASMEELARFYGCSLVLCTATQPDFSALWQPQTVITDIIPDAVRLYQVLGQRVKVKYAGFIDNETLVSKLDAQHQVLCVVNTRKHARILFKMMSSVNGTYHLSANMTPQHRSRIIKEIKERLKQDLPCRVISTQLVEAGVDLDFPTVYRSLAGLDSIAQAAGRANREGKRKEGGMVWVFEPEDGLPRGWFQRMAQLGKAAINRYEDALSPEALKAFFAERFDLHGDELDKPGILKMLEETASHINFPFQDIAQEFQFIDNASKPLVIAAHSEECQRLLTESQHSENPGAFARRLQAHTISLYPWEFEKYAQAGLIHYVCDLYAVLFDEQYYSKKMGLLAVNEPHNKNLIC